MTSVVLVAMVMVGCTASQEKKDEPVTASSPADAAKAKVKSALAALPACTEGAQAGVLTVAPTTCTKKYCGTACCNQCSWAATFEGKNGQKTPADAAKVQAALTVGEGGLDCEVAAWGEALSGTSLALEPAACVVR